MMARIISLLLGVWIASYSYAGSRDDLAVALIPDSLLAGAHSIVRSADYTLNIKDVAHAEFTVHRVVTVIDAAGADELIIYIPYSKYRKIKDIHSATYDYAGRQINKHQSYEMEDFAMVTDALYSDERVKYLRTSGGSYPVTIDVTTVMLLEGIMDYPDWQIQGIGEAVQQSSYTVSAPSPGMVRYRAYHSTLTPEVSTDMKTNKTLYQWSVAGLRQQAVPVSSYSSRYFLPRIDFAPSEFEIDGYKGSLTTWSSFAGAIAAMWQDKKTLTPEIKAEILGLVKNTHTDHEKVAILYAYLQHNFHYVSIQMGIGGIIPFDATTVHRSRYGDCKALSNYMSAILEVAGVRSYPVLINSGERTDAIDTTFPGNKFDHVILYVISDGEPQWLECTSTAMEPGLLGTFTENRYGLTIAPDGRLIRTPSSAAERSRLVISHDISMPKDADVSINASVDICGEYRLGGMEHLIGGKENDQLSYLFKYLSIKRPEQVALAKPVDSAGHITLSFHGLSTHVYDFQNGSKFFLPSTYIAHWYANLSSDTSARYNLLLGFPNDKSEVLTYHLAPGDVSLPPDADLDNVLLSFHRKSIKAADNTVTVHTELKMKVHVLHYSDIALMKRSLQQVSKSLQQRVVYTVLD